jgi:hypothetical protein
MIEPHVHCCVPRCERPIATHFVDDEGQEQVAEIDVVDKQELVMQKLPDGRTQIIALDTPRPICESCLAEAKARAHEAEKKARVEAILRPGIAVPRLVH